MLLECTLLGDFLDPDERNAVVGARAVLGDREDDELQERFGGKRFIDDQRCPDLQLGCSFEGLLVGERRGHGPTGLQ